MPARPRLNDHRKERPPMKRLLIIVVVLAGAAGAGAFLAPHFAPKLVPYLTAFSEGHAAREAEEHKVSAAAPPPAVSVVKAAQADFTELVVVSGSLVPRDEILVAPEVEGFRVLELMVDEGDRVKKGDVLATLVQESLDAQLAQNEASLARAEATISQKNSRSPR